MLTQIRVGKGPEPQGYGKPASHLRPEGRCPKTFGALLDWLKRVWADEPFPERIHSRGVDYSQLGAPPLNAVFRQHADHPMALDENGFFLTPLNAALTRMHHSMPLAAENIWAVIRVDFDWNAVAVRGGWADPKKPDPKPPESKTPQTFEMYRTYLTRVIEELWWLYKMAPS